jgi:hypothetical protein
MTWTAQDTWFPKLKYSEVELFATNNTRTILGKQTHGIPTNRSPAFLHGILFFPDKISLISTDQKLLCLIQFQSSLIDTGILQAKAESNDKNFLFSDHSDMRSALYERNIYLH